MTLQVITDFPGAALGPWRLEGGRLLASIFEEPLVHADGVIHDYSRHFCFGLASDSDSEAVIDVLVNLDADDARPLERTTRIYTSSAPQGEFVPGRITAQTDGSKSYRFQVRLGAHETLCLANSCVRNLDRLQRRMADLAERAGALRLVLGQSVEGRELAAYRWGPTLEESLRPEVLVVSGAHPPEGDTFGTEGMVEMLLDPGRRDEVLKACNLTIIPVMNPDGFAHGYSGCNASLQNVFWAFDPGDEKRMPENFHLWRFMERLRPLVYFDLHGYTFQGDRKKASPYVKPLFFYPGARQAFAARLNERIVARCHGQAMRGYGMYCPSTPGYRLTSRFGTITYAKFHFHIDAGFEGMKSMGADLLRLTAETIREHGPDPAVACVSPPSLPRRMCGWALARAMGAAVRLGRARQGLRSNR